MNKRAIDHLRTDPAMARLIERIGPIRHRPRRVPPFESLVQAIVYQQLSGKAARTIFDRLLGLFGGDGVPCPRAVLALPPAVLRGVGLSQRKTKYIIDLAQRAEAGLVPSLQDCDRMTDSEMIDALTAVKGVGRWTVEMLLIFNLGPPDVLPVDDLGVRRVFHHPKGCGGACVKRPIRRLRRNPIGVALAPQAPSPALDTSASTTPGATRRKVCPWGT